MTNALLALLLMSSQVVPFPGSAPSVSPDKRYRVTWSPPEAQSRGHRLVLTNAVGGTRNTILEFTRHAEVSWSPRGRYLAVTNFSGSNQSEVLVFEPASSLTGQLVRLPERFTTRVSAHGHVYLRAVQWFSSRELLVSVRAHDNPAIHPFEGAFIFRVSGPHNARAGAPNPSLQRTRFARR